jgi:ABC-type glycerol-3-phosphate transport system substrate-binding protein
MRRKMHLLLIALVLASLAAACGPTPTPEVAEKVVKQTVVVEKEIEVTKEVERVVTPTRKPPGPTVIEVITQERWAPYVEKAVQVWNADHPDQQVELDALVLGYPDLRSKIITAAAGGKAPDLSLIDCIWVPEFAEAQYLVPLDELDPDWVDDVAKEDWYEGLTDQTSYDGQLYGLVTQTGTEHLYYRKDWFSAEGIQPPETWDELVEAALYFQQEDIREKYGMGDFSLGVLSSVKGGEATTVRWLMVLWSRGGTVFEDDQVVINGPEGKGALELFYDLVNTHKVVSPQSITWAWDETRKLFGAGKTAMFLGGSYEWAAIQDQTGWDLETMKANVGFIPMPAGPDGSPTTGTGGMAYSIYRQSENPELTFEILKLIVGEDLMYEFADATGQVPPRQSVTEMLDPEEDWFLYNDAQLMVYARPRPGSAVYPRVSEQIAMMLENAVGGAMTVDEALDQAAEAISLITGLPRKYE